MQRLLNGFEERGSGICPFEIKQTPQLDYPPAAGLLFDVSDIAVE